MTSQDPDHHYRGTSIGLALVATLDELPAVSPQLAEKIKRHFDREAVRALRAARVIRKRVSFKARCHTYRFYDDRWCFVLKDVKFKTDSGRSLRSDWLTVNAISSGREEELRSKKELDAASRKKRRPAE